MHLLCAGRVLELDHPVVMGVLNVTPDSFSDGGRYLDPQAAVTQAERMAAEGAAIIDIGGVSTRPGAAGVAAKKNCAGCCRCSSAWPRDLPVLLSVDTSNPEVMRRAASAGAHLINDVRALRTPWAVEAVAAGTLGVCLMHMRGEPATMQIDPQYHDVVEDVKTFLAERVQTCIAAGIARERLCIDPGFGFGKRLAHNLQLLRALARFEGLGLPLAVGLSRKSMVAALGARQPRAAGGEPGAGDRRGAERCAHRARP